MARFRFTPRIEQVAQMLDARLLRASQHPDHDGSGFGDIHDLVARLADRDRLLEDFLAYFQVGSGSPQNRVTCPRRGLYIDVDGGANTTLYVNETGALNGWVAK